MNFNHYNPHFQNQQRNLSSQQYPLLQQQLLDFKISEWPANLIFDPLYEKFSPIMPSWALGFTEKQFSKTLSFALLDEILYVVKKNQIQNKGLDIYIMMRVYQPTQATPLVSLLV